LFLFSFRFFLISDYKEGRVMYLFFRWFWFPREWFFF
jgi:hypothetical protein